VTVTRNRGFHTVADLELRKLNKIDKARGNDSIPRTRGNTREADTPTAALGGAVARRGRENVLDLIEPTWSVVIHRAAHYARHDANASARLTSAFG
jgi:hypothetical protein